eukprot:168268-Amphidinium_carterae.6
MQQQLPKLPELREGSYHGGYSDIEEDEDEDDENDEYDARRQSASTTRASESYTKQKSMKGHGKTSVHRPGAIVTNLYHAKITNFQAVAPPMKTKDDMATGADARATPRQTQQLS